VIHLRKPFARLPMKLQNSEWILLNRSLTGSRSREPVSVYYGATPSNVRIADVARNAGIEVPPMG